MISGEGEGMTGRRDRSASAGQGTGRILRSLIAVGLILTILAGCGGDSDDGGSSKKNSKKKQNKTEITAQGTWVLDSMTMGDTEYTREQLDEAGFTAVLELKKNGKGTLTMNDETNSVTWDKKSVSVNGATSRIVSLDEDTMELSDSDADMIWVREEAADGGGTSSKKTAKEDGGKNGKPRRIP